MPLNALPGESARHAESSSRLDGLIPEVYQALRRIARIHLRRQRGTATVNTTAVVHEAYLKLADGHAQWQDRSHFLALASTAMRQLLVDAARRRLADKRGGGALHVTLGQADGVVAADVEGGLDLPALDQALQQLGQLDPVLERVVECRFFGGLSVAETAEVMGRSVRSVERDWARARAHLYAALRP